MNKKAGALANYLENSSMITGNSDSEFGKTTTLSISLPIERYCLLKELSTRFNVSMTQLVNISLSGFDEKLLFSFSEHQISSIALSVDKQIASELGSSEKIEYWTRRFLLERDRREFEHFKTWNSHLSEDELEHCYSEYRDTVRDGEYHYEGYP